MKDKERTAASAEIKPLSPAAQRALAEADARRQAKHDDERPHEVGRKGPDPIRYGDWEVNGIASDF